MVLPLFGTPSSSHLHEDEKREKVVIHLAQEPLCHVVVILGCRAGKLPLQGGGSAVSDSRLVFEAMRLGLVEARGIVSRHREYTQGLSGTVDGLGREAERANSISTAVRFSTSEVLRDK